MATYKQDMPPSGGYSPINYSRIPMATWNLGLKILVIGGVTVGGFMYYLNFRKQQLFNKVEMNCARLALHPMLQAERDRALLKQCKKNRDDEERIMKDVPGWEVGKWKNNRVFVSIGPDEFVKPSLQEYFAHTDQKYALKAFGVTKAL